MARDPVNSTLPPGLFSTGNFIREEDVQAVQELLNYVFEDTSRQNLYVVAGGTGWDGGAEAATHDVVLANTTGSVVWYRFQIWVDADADSVTVDAAMTIPASNTVDVIFTIGGTSATLTLDNSTQTDLATLNTSATGTGLLTCTLAIEHTAGTDDTTLDTWSVQEDRPSTPAPPDE